MTIEHEQGVTIRRVETHESDQYRAIRLRALADAPEAFATTYAQAAARRPDEWVGLVERMSAVPGCGYWIAEAADGAWIGLAGSYRSETEDGLIELIQVWTDPAARRTGVGRRVIDALIGHGRPFAPLGFGLWIADGNDAARLFYESLGFAVATTTAEPFAACDLWMRLSP